MSRAGLRNRKIVIERASFVTDDYGGEIETWAPLASPLARVIFGPGSERREAAQESASAVATFHVLQNAETASVTPKDRISFDGAAWDITSNIPSLKLNREREITAIRQS